MAVIGDIQTTTEKGIQTGGESSLSNWAGPYVTEMLGRGRALSNEDYNAYDGTLTAGTTELQDAAFEGLGGLASSFTDGVGTTGYTPQAFTSENINTYMNPYLMQSLQPQIDEARRQSEIDRIANADRMTRAGSYGGSRQAVLDAENQSAMQRNIANITGQGYNTAFNNAVNQFNKEQDRNMTAQDSINSYGMTGLASLDAAGAVQRAIESEGIAADRAQFQEERDYPYKQVQYMQSLLQDLPISAQNYSYQEPGYLTSLTSDAKDVESFLTRIFG